MHRRYSEATGAEEPQSEPSRAVFGLLVIEERQFARTDEGSDCQVNYQTGQGETVRAHSRREYPTIGDP